MKIHEVSVVDKAANGKKFLIVKRAGEEPPNPVPEGGEKVKKSLGSKIMSFMKSAFDVEDKAPVDFNTAMAASKKQEEDWQKDSLLYDGIWALRDSIDSISDDESMEDKQSAVLQSLNQFFSYLTQNEIIKAGKKISADRMKALKDIHTNLGDLLAGAGDEDKGDDDTVAKKDHVEGCMCDPCIAKRDAVEKSAGVPEEFKKRLDDMEKRNQDLEAQIQKNADTAKTQEFIQKAASFSQLGIKAEELGPVLKSMAETNPEGYAKMEATLAAVNEQVAKGALFSEKGADGAGESDIVKRVEGMAKEIQKRDNCTIEKARTLVYKENPEIYAEYQNEMRGAK